MDNQRSWMIGVAAMVLVAGAAYAACSLDVVPGEADLASTPPIEMVDAGGIELPPPGVDDPEVERAGVGSAGVDLGASDDPARPLEPVAEADDPSVDVPEANGPRAGEADLGGRVACGGTTCEAGEMCCATEGRCVPEDCPECCNAEDDRPGPGAIGMPETNPVE